MRRGLVVLLILVGLLFISLPVQAQDLVEEEGNVIIDIVLPIALAFIMFSLGLGLTQADFFLVFTEPKAFAVDPPSSFPPRTSILPFVKRYSPGPT